MASAAPCAILRQRKRGGGGVGRRQVIHGAGVLQHRNPIPPAVRIGRYVFSSAIQGEEPASATFPTEPTAQIAQAFRNFEALLAAAACTPANVAKLTVYLADPAWRDHVNPHWLRLFPDPDARPARHTIAGPLPGGVLVQLVFVAVLD